MVALSTGRQVIWSTGTPWMYASRTRTVPPCAMTSTSPPVARVAAGAQVELREVVGRRRRARR